MFDKAFYPLDEAAALLGHKPLDLIHLAAIEEIVLVVGFNDDIRFRTYDANADRTEMPALLEPELLELSASQCQKIELNGRTEQSDFRAGYLIAPNGRLQRLMPSYGGRLYLDHGWAFWRTYRGPYIKEIELLPERLFVVGDDVRRLLELREKSKGAARASKKVEKAEKSPSAQQLRADLVPADLARGTTADEEAVEEKNFPLLGLGKEAIPKSGDGSNSMSILRRHEVEVRTGLSRSTLYDKLNPKSPRYDSSFPKQRNLGTSAVGWIESEIDAWISSRQPVKR